jgi:hypothetical protein
MPASKRPDKRTLQKRKREELSNDRMYLDQEFRAYLVNLISLWSNCETWFVGIFEKLMRIDYGRAWAVIGSIPTTRARVELVQRVAIMCIPDAAKLRAFNRLCKDFRKITTLRNFLMHSTYQHYGETDGYAIKSLANRNYLRGNFDGTNAEEVRQMDEELVEEIRLAAIRAGRLSSRFNYFYGSLQYHVSKRPRDTPLQLDLLRPPRLPQHRRGKRRVRPRQRAPSQV